MAHLPARANTNPADLSARDAPAEPVRVVQVGLGPIGSALARHVVERPGLELVGAVDVDPAKAGHDAGEVIGLERPLGFPVAATLAQALSTAPSRVALHATHSYFDRFKPQILEIVAAGLHVVSTAEELSFPYRDHAQAAEEIDAAARRAGVSVLGTGVNPGFVMDTLPLFLTGICQRVDHISVTRSMNASLRRGPFQAKIGSGLTAEAFRARMAEGRMGHVGLPESMAMLFDTLGRRLARYESSVEPVLAAEPVRTRFFEVQPGLVRGLQQVARGYTDEGEFAVLTFLAVLDGSENADVVQVRGRPNLELRLQGSNGDVATVAIAVNAIRRVVQAPPGLLTMRDLPVVTFW